MNHPNITNWDVVEAEEGAIGELRARWRDLGTAAGSFRAGVSLVEIAPGARATPVHVHADEEEHFYVLEGDGRSWQDGRTYAVTAGDCLLHRVHEEAHTLIAGERGLTVLAFGPRAAEAAAGPLPLPDADEPVRPPTIRSLDAVPPSEDHHGRVRQTTRRIGTALGSETSGLRHVRIEADAKGTPHHCHGAEEELFVVLSGEGVVRLGDERFDVRRGTVVARPPGTGVAHSFIAGPAGLELLAWGTREPNDIVYYPDSDKVYLCGVGVIGRIERLSYWDGEA